MHLRQALTFVQKNPEFPGFFVVVLRGYDTPSAFLTAFFTKLGSLTELTLLDAAKHSLNECKAQLEMSFLGMRKLYGIKNFSSLDAASKKAWTKYLIKYAGPHCVILFESLGKYKKNATPKKSAWAASETQMVIELPLEVDGTLYKELFSFLYEGVAADPHFIRSLFSQQRLSLDDACRLMAYQLVVGRSSEEFFTRWFAKLVVSEASLFTLSQNLLARKPQQFLRQWKACKDDYPPEFWVAYWSEQIWQAAQFVTTARTKSYAEAKKGFYRLPFTFLNNDWQKYTPASLVEAHDELYTFDHTLKNGGGAYALELWYHRFLTA